MSKTTILLIALIAMTPLLHSQTTESGFSPTIKVKGLVHSRYETSLTDSVDVQNKYSGDPVTNNFRMRRIEIRTDIKLTDKWSGVIRLQFPQLKSTSTSNYGNVIELAYADYKVKDAFQIRFGQFKVPFELDEWTSHEDLRMVDRGTTSSLIVSNFQASYQPGIMLFGNLLKDKMPLNYYLAYVNGSNRALPYDDNEQKNIVGRVEFSPVKGFRIGVNAQAVNVSESNSSAFGVDLQIIQKLSDKTKLIVEGEYVQAVNVVKFLEAEADTTLDVVNIEDYNLSGYFGHVLLKIDIDKSWCKTLEFGGKYETTDPLIGVDENAYSTITGNIGFTFLPDNTARLQLNIIHTDWEKPIGGTIDASNIFVAQLQLKI